MPAKEVHVCLSWIMIEKVVHFFEERATDFTYKSNHVFSSQLCFFFFLLLHSSGFHLKVPQSSLPPVVCFWSVGNVCIWWCTSWMGGASKRLDLYTCLLNQIVYSFVLLKNIIWMFTAFFKSIRLQLSG